MRIRANLVLCQECKRVPTFIDGNLQGEATFWMKNGKPAVSVHGSRCPFRGKEIS
jgi:hypothetical protein